MKIGVDWGGTKIEAVAIDPVDGSEIKRTKDQIRRCNILLKEQIKKQKT